MAKFTVHLQNVVSSAVEVEAEDYVAAIDAAYDSPGMPGSITIGAFGKASVDEAEWQPAAVEDESGNLVWEEER